MNSYKFKKQKENDKSSKRRKKRSCSKSLKKKKKSVVKRGKSLTKKMVKRFEKTSDYYDGADNEEEAASVLESMKAASILESMKASEVNVVPVPDNESESDDDEIVGYLREYLPFEEQQEIGILLDTPVKVPIIQQGHDLNTPTPPPTPPPVNFRDNGKYKKPRKKNNRKRKVYF